MLRDNKKNGENPSAVQNRRTEIKDPRADHAAHEENKFYAAKGKIFRGKRDPRE
jgi:hypothetical protein